MPIIRSTGGVSDDSYEPFSDGESLSTLNSVDTNRELQESSSSSRPDEVTTDQLLDLTPELGEVIFDVTSTQNKYWNGVKWVAILSEEDIQDSVKEDIQGYYAIISKSYSADAAVRAENPVVEVLADTWTKLEIDVLDSADETPDAQKALGIFDAADNRFSLAGLDDGSNILMRAVVRLRPDVDEGSASLRLNFTTNTATQPFLTGFPVETQLFNMTQGADVDYSDEAIITAFVGSTLSGSTLADSGSFVLEINSTVDTDLEVLAFTLYINK